MTITLYGIPNCDTVKKARTWLEARGLAYIFHDYKKAGASADKLAGWIAAAGLNTVLNRAGTTFKKLPEERREGLDEAGAIVLMVEAPSMIKRPVVEYPGGLLVGFKVEEWEKALG
jgi:Spx/MgsR family transcriptional regulator